ncbi:MAG: glycosyltransferase family 39 protein [Acidobacteria bacterium]|nr:glycosyltransferase family 39 protein [Acidobacteriota bacterium]
MNLKEKLGTATLAVAAAVFVALRFRHLADSCLWFDEIFGVHAAGMSFVEALRFVAQDLIHPPLFYLLLKGWIALGGEGLFWLRFFSVFFMTLAVVPFVLLGRELKLSDWTIGLALFLFAVNGSLVKYAQEVRMYGPFLFFAVCSMWLFARFLNLGKNIWILTLVNLLLIYTHYFGWLLVGAEVAAILILQRIKIRQILIMFGILLAGFAPWAFAVFEAARANAGLGQNIGWIGRPDLRALGEFLLDLVEPFYYQQSTAEPASLYLLTVPLAVAAAGALAVYLAGWKRLDEAERKNLVLLTVLIALPIAAAFGLSWVLPYSIWGTRHLLFVFVPCALLAATALTRIRIGPLAAALTALVLIFCAIEFLAVAGRPAEPPIWCAWEALAAKVDRTKPSRIYVFEDLVAYDLWFALRDAGPRIEVVRIDGIDEIPEDKSYFLPRGFDGVRRADVDAMTGDRFFVVYRDAVFNEKHPPLRQLVAKGYHIGEPVAYETPGLNAFLVEVTK